MRNYLLIIVPIVFCFDTKICAQASSNPSTKQGQYAKSDYYANLRPSDPEHAALGSYGRTPINYFTGLPEISLNLLTLTSRELSIPITLTYDATGVKLNDVSGPVGLKWNLDAGGYVARQMNGYPDEEPDLGYWKYETQINSLSPFDRAEWVAAYEKNTRDFEPDEFVLFVNGRSVRFFIKGGVPYAVPKQNVDIKYTLANNKIDKFEFTTEDGIKYVFGGMASAIEERKVETLNLKTKYDFQIVSDVIRVDSEDQLQGTFNIGSFGFDLKTETSEISVPFYNDKWYLVSITAPSGDQINFSYTKDADQKSVTMPVVTRIDNVLRKIDNYSYTIFDKCYKHVAIFGGCEQHQDFPFTHDNVFVNAAFSNDCLDTNCDTGIDWTATNIPTISQSQTDKYFDQKIAPEAGGNFVNQSLITQSTIRLTGISTSVGNRLAFLTSSRTDMPGAFKYDRIDLFNVDNQLVKTIKLNFTTVDAATTQDYLWLSEAYMASRITTLKPNGDGDGDYYARHFRSYSETDINSQLNSDNPTLTNSRFIKYAFEGLKDYNFKRLFLENITQVTNATEKTLYSFVYKDRNLLRRRNTPMQDVFGVSANYNGLLTAGYPEGEIPLSLQFGAARAMIIKAYNPEGLRQQLSPPPVGVVTSSPDIGVLTKIIYPTGGKTEFNFTNGYRISELVLRSVVDKDENDVVVQQKQLVYLARGFFVTPITTSFRNVRDQNSTRFFQIRTVSSSAQNRAFRPTMGVYSTNQSVKVFNGTSTDHTGYEIFNYSTDPDVNAGIRLTVEDPVNGPFDAEITTDIYPFPRVQEKDHLRGLLLNHYVYNKGGALLTHTNNQYSSKNFYQVNSNTLIFNPVTIYGFFGGSFSFADGPIKYRYGLSSIAADWVHLDKTTEKVYDQSTPQDLTKFTSIVKEYTYDPYSLQLTETKTYNEQIPTSFVSTKTKYVTHSDYDATNYCNQKFNQCTAACGSDLQCQANCVVQQTNCLTGGSPLPPDGGAVVSLKSKRQINSPVEIQSWIQEGSISKLTSAIVYKYNLEGTTNKYVKPKEIWGLKQPLDATAFTTTALNVNGNIIPDSKMRKLHTYDTYQQPTGNLLQQTSLDGTVTAYQWGYNNTLVSQMTTNPGSLQQQANFIHQPLVGITQTADANGRNVNYEYDRINRLKLVRDHDNNIQKRYRYHYKDEMDNAIDFQYTTYSNSNSDTWIQFTALSSGEPGTSLTWDFGNGTVKENGLASELQRYTTPGPYTVKLMSKHPEYPAAAVSKTIRILPFATAVITDPAVTPNTNITVCGSQNTTCTVNTTGGPYTYQWQYNYSASGSSTYLPIGTNSPTLVFNLSGVQASSNSIRCKVIDADGNFTYSSTITVFYYCQGQPGPGDCQPGWTWNSQLGRCDPPPGTCGSGCFWNGVSCVCP